MKGVCKEKKKQKNNKATKVLDLVIVVKNSAVYYMHCQWSYYAFNLLLQMALNIAKLCIQRACFKKYERE